MGYNKCALLPMAEWKRTLTVIMVDFLVYKEAITHYKDASWSIRFPWDLD